MTYSTPDDGAENIMFSAPVVLYNHAGRFSCCTSAGVLFYSVDRKSAEQHLAEAGVDASVLNSPVDGITWRSCLTQAFASEILSLSDQIESLPQTADVEAVRSKQEIIEDSIKVLSASVAAEQRRREIEAGEIELNRRAEATFAQVGGRDNPTIVATVWASMRNSALGRRIQELRNQ